MHWDPDEAVAYYKGQGAPADQNALVSLLKEAQEAHGGRLPGGLVGRLAQGLGAKESLLLALIRRIPSLHLADINSLELCGGPNCSHRGRLAEFVEKTYGPEPKNFAVRYTPCMRMCGKGPNIKWDGTLYHQADEALLRRLIEGKQE